MFQVDIPMLCIVSNKAGELIGSAEAPFEMGGENGRLPSGDIDVECEGMLFLITHELIL